MQVREVESECARSGEKMRREEGEPDIREADESTRLDGDGAELLDRGLEVLDPVHGFGVSGVLGHGVDIDWLFVRNTVPEGEGAAVDIVDIEEIYECSADAFVLWFSREWAIRAMVVEWRESTNCP